MPRLYISRNSPTYTPPTVRGAWESTSNIARSLQSAPDVANQGAVQVQSGYEVTTLTAYDVLLIRAVTPPLAADYTFGGTLNVMLPVQSSASNSSNSYYIHAYVTTGATDTVRGTLLANYFESSTGDWPTTAAAKALLTTQSLAAVAALTGDRVVVEIGFRAKNGFSPQQFGYLYYGGYGPDILAGGAPTSGVGYLDFSDGFTLNETQTVRVSQVATEVLRKQTNSAARITQVAVEAIRRPSAPPARVSQMTVEVVRKNATPLPTTTLKPSLIVIAT